MNFSWATFTRDLSKILTSTLYRPFTQPFSVALSS
jgi:hypothetical protein